MKTTFSIHEARRIALGAQGFGGSRAHADAPATWRSVQATARRLGVLQIDSVNVLARAHYMPAFARLGAYDRDTFDDRAFGRGRKRAFFEYWAHEASLLPLDLHPAMRWRMAQAEAGIGVYKTVAAFARENPTRVARVLAEIATRGPLSAGEIEEAGKARSRGAGGWWGWSEAKYALEHLFWSGRVTTSHRRGFERVYDLTERVIPADIVARPALDPAEAHRVLIAHSAQALGIATETDLRNYFRLSPEASRTAVAQLVEAGQLIPARVEGWPAIAYLSSSARLPRAVDAHALVSPFDPLVWERARTERLFDFHYRIEIYVPAHKRQHGYYVLPFLFGDKLAARVDLKANRATGVLEVPASHLEPGNEAGPVAEALAAELGRLASWLNLERVQVADRGDLGGTLRMMVTTDQKRRHS